MSAVSMNVTPASSAAWMVRIAWSSSGNLLSEFMETGIAPRPIAETSKGPSFLVCILGGYPLPFDRLRARVGCRVTARPFDKLRPRRSAADGGESLSPELGHLRGHPRGGGV